MAYALRCVLVPASIAALAVCGVARGQEWQRGVTVDPDSVEELTAAVVENAAGFHFAVARATASERTLGFFRLPASDRDFLDPRRPLTARIDEEPARQLVRVAGGLKSLSFRLWDGQGEPVIGPLRELMEGREITFEYPLHGGGHKNVTLPLLGAKAVIADVLGVQEEIDTIARDLAMARTEAVEGCLAIAKKKAREKCMTSLVECKDAASADELQSCLE